MAIVYDKERKTYFITYKIKMPDGTYKSRKLRNKEWTKKRLLQQEEEELIRKDKEKFLNNLKTKQMCFSNVFDSYLEKLELTKAENTIYNNKLVYKNYIQPHIDENANVQDIYNPMSLSVLTNKIREECKIKKVSSNRYNRAITILKGLGEYAYSLDLIDANSYLKAKMILQRDNTRVVKTEKLEFWTKEQFDTFVETFNEVDQKRKLLFEVVFWGGFRIGELLALTWGDFDPIGSTLSVNKSLNPRGYISITKNAASMGRVDMPHFITEKLIEFKKAYNNPEDDKYIFFYKPVSRTLTRKMMAKHIKMAGVPYIKFHGLRHSTASLMINAGAIPLAVSKHLRHASTQQTLDTYSHLYPSENNNLMDKIFTQMLPKDIPNK